MTLNKLKKLKEHFDEVIKNKDVHPEILISHRWLSNYIKSEEEKLNNNKQVPEDVEKKLDQIEYYVNWCKPVQEEVEKNLKENAKRWHKTFG